MAIGLANTAREVSCLYSQIKTSLQSLENKSSTDFSYPPDTRKQKMAMPPNYVHSLDSTHMMLTALFCEKYAPQMPGLHHVKCLLTIDLECRLSLFMIAFGLIPVS